MLDTEWLEYQEPSKSWKQLTSSNPPLAVVSSIVVQFTAAHHQQSTVAHHQLTTSATISSSQASPSAHHPTSSTTFNHSLPLSYPIISTDLTDFASDQSPTTYLLTYPWYPNPTHLSLKMPKAYHLHVYPEAGDEFMSWLEKLQINLWAGWRSCRWIYELAGDEAADKAVNWLLMKQASVSPWPCPSTTTPAGPWSCLEESCSGQVKVDTCQWQVGQATVQIITACQWPLSRMLANWQSKDSRTQGLLVKVRNT